MQIKQLYQAGLDSIKSQHTATINLDYVAEKIILSAIYAISLVLLYSNYVYPKFVYMDYPYYGTNWGLVSIQVCLISAVSCTLPSEFNKISDLCSWLLFKMVFVPTMVIAGLVVEDISFTQLLMTNSILVICMLSIILTSNIKVTANFPALSQNMFWLLTIAIATFFIAFIIKDYGLSFSRLLDLRNYSDIYDIRHAHRDLKAHSSFISNYGLLWLAKVIIPLFWGWGLYKKSKIIIILALIAQVGLFAVSAHKSFLFGLIFIYFIYWVYVRANSGIWFLRAIVGFTIFSSLVLYIFDFELFVSIIVRRVFIVPGMLSGFFLEFYSHNPFAMYAHSFLSGIYDSVYSTTPAFTVGKAYFGGVADATSANVNFWGDAYGNLGYFGLIFITLVLNILLILINGLSSGKSQMLCLSIFAISFWTISETSLLTTIVSHGLGLAILLTFLLYREPETR